MEEDARHDIDLSEELAEIGDDVIGLIQRLPVDEQARNLVLAAMLDEEYGKFYKATITECAVFGLFCIANIILAVWSLCVKHIGTLRTFRVYGASNAQVTRLVVMLIMIITLAAGVIGGALCIPMQKLYENINPDYAWRPYCMYIAVGALTVINLIAVIPTAILIVRKSPIGKEGN